MYGFVSESIEKVESNPAEFLFEGFGYFETGRVSHDEASRFLSRDFGCFGTLLNIIFIGLLFLLKPYEPVEFCLFPPLHSYPQLARRASS